jgi:hypothetical protein
VDFDSLELPFASREVDDIVKKMPTNRSSGPDGFNGTFLKRSGPIVKDVFYRLCNYFYEGSLNIESTNTAFIMLIPKTGCPEEISEY